MNITRDSTSRYVNAGAHRLHYHEAGEGPVLLMLHGGGAGAGGWANYSKNITPLARHFRVILLDLIGFGRSAKTPVVGTLYRFHAQVVRDFLDAMGIERVHVVGNSLSGGVVLRLLLDTPDRIARVVLMGPGGGLPLFSPWPTLGLRLGMGYYTGPGPSRERLRQLLELMVWDKSLVTDELVEERYEASIAPEIIAQPPLGKGKRLPDEDLWREPLHRIEHPILVLWGRDDEVVPLDSSLVLLRQLKNAELHVFAQCGHWVMLERAAQFNEMVHRFLTDAMPASSA